ncbi:hypothetical protein [Helicobacter felistomachi]|uniref:hypothetical protein n=1 Tax=Helicobacter felistomachi TaxID=3040201 RepID=UPI0025739E21|nr:hypothetical protein [Helicobacter sp. NHP21005]
MMFNVLEIAAQLQTSIATQAYEDHQACQIYADLMSHYKTFKELWAQYKPLEDQQERQKQVFKAKRQVLCDLLDYEPLEVLNLYRWNIEDKDTKEALDKCYRDWMVEKYDVPDLGTYQKDRQKFQDKLNGFSRGVADLLASSPKLTEPERLKGWAHFIELKRLACQEAYSTFIQLYKEECKAKGKKSIGYGNIDGEAYKAWCALSSSLDSLENSLKKMLQYTVRISRAGALRSLVDKYTGAYADSFSLDNEEGLKQLLGFQEAVARIKNADEKVLEAKGVLEQRIIQCQERLQECNALLNQEGITWEQEEQIKKPFEEACKGLILEVQALLQVVDASLGVAQVRQVQGTLWSKREDLKTNKYNTPAFKKALDNEVLKPLEESFLNFNEAPNLQFALDTFKSILQIALQEITEAFLNLEPTYQKLQAEGIVDRDLHSKLRDSVETSLKALSSSVRDLLSKKDLDENTDKMLRESLFILENGLCYSVSGIEEKSNAEREEVLSTLGAELDKLEHLSAPQENDDLKAVEQIREFLKEKLAQEKRRYEEGDAIRPLWDYEGDNLQAYADYTKESVHNAEACLELGKMAAQGIVLPKSSDLAHSYFDKAIELGSIRALTHLGLLYLDLEEKQQAFECFTKALVLGDVCAYVGLEKLRHLNSFSSEMYTLNDTLVKNAPASERTQAHRFFSFETYIKDPKEADAEAQVMLEEVQGECLHEHHFSYEGHIDEEYGVDTEYRENYIEPCFEDLFDDGVYATMDGLNARLHLNMLKTIDTVYGKPKKEDYQKAYENAKEAYQDGVELGSGRCALELGHMYLDQFAQMCKSLPAKQKKSANLEANHNAITCFKKALQCHFNAALDPLIDLLQAQQELLKKMPNVALSAQYAHDLEQAKTYEKALHQACQAKDPKQWGPVSFVPDFLENASLSQDKSQEKPQATEEKVKPLWQYDNNTKQAFKDYMEAKDKNNASAWLELGKMSLLGVVVPPDPIGAMVCFEKAKDLGSLQAYYGSYLADNALNAYTDSLQERLQQEPQPNYNSPLKSSEIKEGLECIFSMSKPAGGGVFRKYEGVVIEDWVFEQGENRGRWFGSIKAWEQSEFEEILEAFNKQANKDDAPMHAWGGILRINVGCQAPDVWSLVLLHSREQKNLLRYQANEAYEDIMQAIKEGYVDGHYLLGVGDLHGRLHGFFVALQKVRANIIEETGNDEFSGEIYGGEEDYLEGLAPDDPEDEGEKFYHNQRKKSLLKGTKAGSTLCGVALVELYEKGTKLKTQKLFDKRHVWIELLTPFWEQQRNYRALMQLIKLLEQQIAFCEDQKGLGFNAYTKEKDVPRESLETLHHYQKYKGVLLGYREHLKQIGSSAESLNHYYIGCADYLFF